ncbi:ubiquitin-conjugating enzyme E2 4-like [Drosophila obscura]|uniref:ubiquitin-conjugating enzyme E2 4-like n=1 Tax=Drosophila obscura TaxID=7282 RepID=UPI000B9FCBCD|nr:ubiquitin-conjugating enzyme E2 4-like [Drosophila obscura]
MPQRRSARIRDQRADDTRTRTAAQRPSTRRATRAARSARAAAQRAAPEVLQILRRETAFNTDVQNIATVSQTLPQGRRSSRTQNGAQGQEQQPLSRSSFPASGIRLSREMTEMMLNPADGCQVEFVGDNTHHWLATILGPSDTPYEGGHFHLDLLFPENYPLAPPDVKFLTPIYHCNVCGDGYLCLDILSDNWTPVLTVEKVLLSIRSLLADPNPDDPLAISVANMYKADRAQHDQIAREWTTRYATPEAF